MAKNTNKPKRKMWAGEIDVESLGALKQIASESPEETVSTLVRTAIREFIDRRLAK